MSPRERQQLPRQCHATFGGAQDAFVARIDTTATTSDSPGHNSSYLGGSGNDFGTGIATDSQSNAYVAGETASTNFPLASSFQSRREQLEGEFRLILEKHGMFLENKSPQS